MTDDEPPGADEASDARSVDREEGTAGPNDGSAAADASPVGGGDGSADGRDGESADADGPSGAPLEELATEIRSRKAAADRDDDVGDEDRFESVDVGAVDEEAVWESFVEGEVDPEERVGVGADVEAVGGPDEHVVPKREFCQRCPHFTDPPETACTHEGTTIVEMVEGDRFRVRNCPIVAEREAAAGDRPAE